jgi:hypothetical protein
MFNDWVESSFGQQPPDMHQMLSQIQAIQMAIQDSSFENITAK